MQWSVKIGHEKKSLEINLTLSHYSVCYGKGNGCVGEWKTRPETSTLDSSQVKILVISLYYRI